MGVEGRAPSAHHTLDPLDRRICGWMAAMGLWSKRELAREFGVGESTVRKHMRRYGGELHGITQPQEPGTVPSG